MPENNKTHEFLQKIAPCIERGELEQCVEKAALVAGEMGVGAGELLDLATQKRKTGEDNFAYVLALAAAQGLEGKVKANAHYIAGLAAQVIEKPKESEENYKKAIEICPEFSFAQFNYALLLAQLDRKNEAEEHYKKAIEINPDNAEAHYNYAILLEKQRRRDEAEDHYKKVIDKPNFELSAHFNYALLLAQLDRKNEAEEHYKKVIELSPGLGEVHNNYANLLREKGRFSEAEKEVRIALRIEPANPYYHGTLGDIHADEDCLEDAIKEYQEALKKSDFMNRSATSEVRNNLGRAYALLEQNPRAEKEFEEALKLDDMNVKARRNLRKLRKRELPTISKIQKFFAAILFLFLILFFILFLIGRLSDTVFASSIIFMIAFLIFILLYHQIVKFKAGPFEFEKSTEHRLIEVKKQELERSS